MGSRPSFLQSRSTYSTSMEVSEAKMKYVWKNLDIIEIVALLIWCLQGQQHNQEKL